MTRVLPRAAAVATAAGVLLVTTAGPAVAHQTWFVHHADSYPLDWSALTRPAVVAGALAAVAVTLAWRLAARRVGSPELPWLARVGALASWAPRLLALHLGAALLALSLMGAVLDPGVGVPDGLGGTALLVPQVVAGVLLVAGRYVVPAALAVVAAGPVLVALSSARSLLTCLVLVGVAGFLVLVPPQRDGRASLDPHRLAPALLCLRVGAAGSLITLAVVEKLANPAMGIAMLEQEPVLNLLAPVGGSAETFVLVVGLVELLFGLLVLSGAAPQVVSLVAAVPFTATLTLFGGTELVGHLPVYGVLLALLLLGSNARTAPLVPAVAQPVRELVRA